jgi:hypothetical protein
MNTLRCTPNNSRCIQRALCALYITVTQSDHNLISSRFVTQCIRTSRLWHISHTSGLHWEVNDCSAKYYWFAGRLSQ